MQAAWLGCTNVGGTPAVGLHPPHPVVASWTHTVGVVWTSMARYFYGHPSTRTNGQCRWCGWDAQTLGESRRRFAPSTPGGRLVDAHRRRGLDSYGQIPLWQRRYVHERALQAAWLGCRNVWGAPAVGVHPPHPVVASWTHTVGVVWTSMARYLYGRTDTCTNGQCKRRGWDAQMLGGPPPSVCTLHTRWSRRGRTPQAWFGLLKCIG